jgi:hypothetical protein
MNIDRHNYEEYFLLYIDSELSVDQKKQVELFVQENPDLEEELVMLQQSRLIPDDSIVFDRKHLLMKEEDARHSNSFINLNNYEQWLIMYVDDELSAEERAAVKKFASAHQHVQQELELFQQTKLQAEEIVFPGKETLYRREKSVRVISIQWWKVAVAAVLIISAGVTVYSVLINKNTAGTNNEITKTTIAKKQAPPVDSVVPDKQQPNVIDEQKGAITVTIPVTKESNNKRKEQKQQEQENNQQLAYNSTEKLIESIDEVKRRQPTTVEINERTTKQPKMTDAVAIDEKMHKENINTDPVTKAGVETPDKSSTSDDAVQYASNAENKKFRGFFRKATRLIERTTNINAADDDKVLIGGMAINLK